jgi:hypothetical protein
MILRNIAAVFFTLEYMLKKSNALGVIHCRSMFVG